MIFNPKFRGYYENNQEMNLPYSNKKGQKKAKNKKN